MKQKVICIAIVISQVYVMSGCRQEKQDNNSKTEASQQATTTSFEDKEAIAKREELELVARKVKEADDAKLEKGRADVFSIPLSEEMSKIRREAWDALQFKDPEIQHISGEQYEDAYELMGNFTDASPIEKLMIWRLVDCLIYERQRSLSSFIGFKYTQREIAQRHTGLRNSALGIAPDKVMTSEEDYQTHLQALEMLRKAAQP